jgi:hypothetical protein
MMRDTATAARQARAQRPAWRPGQRWAEIFARYVESFGPEASAMGPPPGYEPAATADEARESTV